MTADEVRQLVAEAVAPTWTGRGEFAIAQVMQDDAAWAVSFGNREWIEDDDPRFMLLDPPLALVNKSTGVVEFIPYAGNEGRLDAMRQADAT